MTFAHIGGKEGFQDETIYNRVLLILLNAHPARQEQLVLFEQ
jgi:hypothetical protein